MDERLQLLECLMDNLKDPFVFVDAEHIIQYMNRGAVDHYRGKPAQVGKSIFACHNEDSKRIILDVFESFRKGENERMIVDDERQRVYMRAVRDKEGNLLGYFERFQPLKESV